MMRSNKQLGELNPKAVDGEPLGPLPPSFAPKSVRLRRLAIGLVGIAAQVFAASSAHAVSGFTGVFRPDEWHVFVNTDPASLVSPLGNPDFLCNTPGFNSVSCLKDLVAATGSVKIVSSDPCLVLNENSPAGCSNSSSTSTTSLQITNSYWRPWRISFNFSFYDPLSSDPEADPPQYDPYPSYLSASIETIPGYINPNQGAQDWRFATTTNTAYADMPASVYLPPGATLKFSVISTNDGPGGFVSISNFDAVELPAPLPVAGGGAAFAFSRRLRRRQRLAAALASQLLPGAAGRAPSVAALHRRQHQRQALRHYGALIGGLQPLAAPLRSSADPVLLMAPPRPVPPTSPSENSDSA